MRSQKEIEENSLSDFHTEVKFENGKPTNTVLTLNCTKLKNWLLEGEPRYTLKELEEEGLIFSLEHIKKIVEQQKRLIKFIKEPHYSVAELEKIFDALVGGKKSYEWDTAYFVEFLKDKARVEAILNE